MLPSVLVIILNWNSAEETKAAVESVFRMDYHNLSVVIIENGSTDNSAEMLQSLTNEHVELIISPENLGYTGGCNLGFDLALRKNTDYVWLLNSDALSEPRTLSSLVHVAEENPRIGLISPLIASRDHNQQLVHVLGKFNPDLSTCESTKDVATARRWVNESPERLILLGTALLVRTSLIRKIGGLDASLFAYWEDVDFSVRVLNAGFFNAVDFDSVVYHTEKSIRTAPHSIKPYYFYYMARNEVRFWKKHVKLIPFLKAAWWSYTTQIKFLKLLKGNEVSRQAILAGIWHGWRGKSGSYQASFRMPSPLATLIEMHSERY